MSNLYYKTSDGLMYYEVDGKGEPLVLLHGWGQTLRTFDSFVSNMKGTLINIVRYDLTKSLLKNKNKIVILASVNDSEVEYKDEIKMYKYLYNCEIYPFYKSNHFLYLTEEKKFIDIFIKEVNK